LVSGKADRAVAGQLMTIRAVRSEPTPNRGFGNRTPVGEPVELARVRIAQDGTFAYRWRPAQPGDYTLGALYQSQSPKFADDFSIPANLRVSKLLRPSARGRRRGRLIVSVARGALAGARGRPCSGRVKLEVRSGKKRVGVRSTPLGRTCRWSKRYAIPTRLLPPRQRRRLADGKPVTLTVRARFQGNARLVGDLSPSRAYRIKP